MSRKNTYRNFLIRIFSAIEKFESSDFKSNEDKIAGMSDILSEAIKIRYEIENRKDLKDYSHFILFAKGFYADGTVNDNYFKKLRRIASNWNGIEERFVDNQMVWRITSELISRVLPVEVTEFFESYSLVSTFNPKMEGIELFIRTNMSIICNWSSDDIGCDWSFLDEAKNNLINMDNLNIVELEND